MKRIILSLVVLSCFLNCLISQNLVSELYGFKLGQFREVPHTEFQEPMEQEAETEGLEYDLFILEPDSSAYMIFEYPDWNKNEIWSIQVYGPNLNAEPIFKDIKMGMSKEQIISILGQPSEIKNQGEYGDLLLYVNTNYSFEIDTNNRLSSIKIINTYSDFFPAKNADKRPDLNGLKKALLSNDNETIGSVLSPSMAIHNEENAYFFQYPWEKEVNEDKSGIFRLIKLYALDLKKLNLDDSNTYSWETIEMESSAPLQKLKLHNSDGLKEIVFKWELGKYLIWEIGI